MSAAGDSRWLGERSDCVLVWSSGSSCLVRRRGRRRAAVAFPRCAAVMNGRSVICTPATTKSMRGGRSTTLRKNRLLRLFTSAAGSRVLWCRKSSRLRPQASKLDTFIVTKRTSAATSGGGAEGDSPG